MSAENPENPVNVGKNFFVIHGHFYQPPREDPFTGKIPVEPGAHPFPNWNEKIYDQCYRPNAEVGNFSRISFDLGPTLASWMEAAHPDTYRMIVEQENEVYRNYGFSNGMAQSYNHTILPLATREDKETQVYWGIVDFEHRFGHKPQGLWMPETAADLETLKVLEKFGINYTIMAPWQAKTRRKLDVSHPYWVDLGDDKRINVFFYDRGLSDRISFDPASTVNADGFLYEVMLPKYAENSKTVRYYMAASDGELYGHHQPFREKFLEWLTTGALVDQPVEMAFPEQILRAFLPKVSMRINEKTSWSCHHGVKRWSTVCDCAEHGEWKHGMRHAFNRIAEHVDEVMQEALSPYGCGLQEFRNEYALVLTGQESCREQLARLIGTLPEDEENRLVLLMKAQYERQRMFTSCGWFFGDFERIESRNNLAYAAMAVYLVEKVTGDKSFYQKIYRALNHVESATTGVRAATLFANAFARKNN